MDDSMTSVTRFTDEVSGYSVVFDDDGRVAYAYLLDPNEKIVGDVWLYNRCESPVEPEWRGSERIPFANPASYVRDDADFEPIDDVSDICVVWESREPSVVKACLFVRRRAFAILTEGAKPGWSILAKKNGPLAKVLGVREESAEDGQIG